MKTVSILTPCYNEEANVEELYKRVRQVMLQIGKYRYEHVFIDNSSKDRTVEIIKRIAAQDTNVRLIVNTRNFGQIRSPMHAFYNVCGDCVIGLVADFQDPPDMIPEFLDRWEQGFPVVIAVKEASQENAIMFRIRKAYYALVNRVSSIETYQNFTGFGLYDRKVIDMVKDFRDPYPYFRGIIAEIGLPHSEIYYKQPRRTRGITKNNFYTLYDLAMLGITNLSKVPLRAVTFFGFASALVSLLIGLFYLFYKLVFWQSFSIGVAPLVIGLFFFGSVQMLALGILGEYIGSIHTFVQNRPLVVEKERINFEYPPGQPAPGE
jgi:glycosyltransferase involved in cell wall biosynthesis